MFEQSVLDNSRQRRSKWSWMGLVVQAGAVTSMLLVPMISPEILSVMLPKAMIYVPAKQPPPVEVEVKASANRSSAAQTVTARPAYRVFTAPKSYDHPAARIIDAADFNPLPFSVGNGRASAESDQLAGGIGIGVLPTAPPPRQAAPVKKEPPKPLRVGGSVQAANIVQRVNPSYPQLAKQARIQGLVRLEGIIARDGSIQQLKVISGHPLLVPAAVEAVRQWRYRPTLLNGEPVEVIAPIDVNFILSN